MFWCWLWPIACVCVCKVVRVDTGLTSMLTELHACMLCKERLKVPCPCTTRFAYVFRRTRLWETLEKELWSPYPPKHMWHVSSTLPNSPSKQGHQFSGVRGFVVKSPVDLHKVCVLQLSTDGLQLVVRLVNNLGLYFRQGFGGVIRLFDSLPDSNQSMLCFPSSASSTHFFSPLLFH